LLFWFYIIRICNCFVNTGSESIFGLLFALSEVLFAAISVGFCLFIWAFSFLVWTLFFLCTFPSFLFVGTCHFISHFLLWWVWKSFFKVSSIAFKLIPNINSFLKIIMYQIFPGFSLLGLWPLWLSQVTMSMKHILATWVTFKSVFGWQAWSKWTIMWFWKTLSSILCENIGIFCFCGV